MCHEYSETHLGPECPPSSRGNSVSPVFALYCNLQGDYCIIAGVCDLRIWDGTRMENSSSIAWIQELISIDTIKITSSINKNCERYFPFVSIR